MNKVEQIRKEIERRHKWYKDELEKYSLQSLAADIAAKAEETESILSFIAPLQEGPVSKDLEEAANAYIYNESNWIHSRTETFKTGAEWQKQHLIEKACEWLEEHLLDFWSQIITNTDYFIEEFKQAMEE